MAIGTRRHRLLTGENVGSIVRWTVADATARLALSLLADEVGAVCKQTDDQSYWVLTATTPTWTQLGNTTNNTSSASDPTVGDDELDGYAIGDGWVNTTDAGVFILTDATAGAAVWTGLSGAVSSVFGRTGAVVAVAKDYDDNEIGLSSVIGSPTNDLLSEYLNITGSVATVNGGGGITDDTDGTITVAAGEGCIRATDSDTAALLSFDFSAEAGAGVALADNDMNYVYVEYNSGTPQTVATTTERTDYNTNLYLGSVYRSGTTLHITEHKAPTGNVSNRVHRYLTDVNGLANVSGAAVSESGSARTLAITAGMWWHGLEQTSTAAIDTNVADTFFRYYQDGAGGFTVDATETVISNSIWDDGDGGLGALTGSRYGVHWVFKAVDGDTYVVVGRGNYTSAQADAATVPANLPAHFAENHATLCAKITVGNGDTNFTSIESAFVKHFTSEAVTDHGDLAGLGDDDHNTGLGAYAQTLSGAGAPGVSTGDGYRLGTTYADTTNDESYILVDATGGANVWSAGGASDHGALTGLSDDDHNTGVGAYAQQINGAGAPGVSTGDGYRVGTVYIDTTADEAYFLADATGGSNVWVQGGTGDVVGPASATDNYVARWDGTSGKLTQDSKLYIGDSGDMTNTGVGADFAMLNRASGPTLSGGYSHIWSLFDGALPSELMHTDDLGVEYLLHTGDRRNVVAATTVAGTLTTDFENTDTIDGVTLATGDRILIKDQAAGAENGIYVVEASGAPTRASDLPTGAFAATISMNVQEGTLNAGSGWKCSNVTGTDVVNTDALVFVADVNASGTVAQDAAFFTERADHVNTPATGFGELWLDNATPNRLRFTDDAGTDHAVVRGPTAATTNAVATFSLTGGVIKNSGSLIYAGGELFINSASSALKFWQRASAPTNGGSTGQFWVKDDDPTTPWFTDDVSGDYQLLGTTGVTAQDAALLTERADHVNTPAAGKAEIWVKNDAPNKAMFTDDDGTDFVLNGDSVNQQITLASNVLVDVDATEVVLGGGYIDGSSGGTYVWELLGEYNDGGGTGNQDIEIRLYDMGADGAPTAGTLRSVLEITSLDTLDRVALTLSPVTSPGTDTDEIHNVARMYEVRAYLDAAGAVDTASIASVEFGEVGGFLGGGVTDDGVTLQDAVYFTERADHVNTPATGKGELWLESGTSPPTLIYTDEAGADKTVAAGVTSGNAAQVLAVNAGGTDFEFVKQYRYVYMPITFAGAATGTYYGHPANAMWTYTGNNTARGTTQGTPTTPNYHNNPTMCFAGKVVKVTGFYNHIASTYGGDIELWKAAHTDDSATVTMTEMGATGGFYNIPTTGHVSGRNYDLTTTISSTNTFAVGDQLEILYWQDAVGVIRGSLTLTCEVT